MGFFSTKTTYVSSTAYNLAGNVENRGSYMKTLMIGSIVGNSNSSMGETFRDGYMNGPGMRLRKFFRWAENNYGEIGVPTGSLGSTMNIDQATVESHIPGEAEKTVVAQRINAGSYDYAYFAEQWMFENHPTLVGTLWQSDIDSAGQITIRFEDLSTASFTPVANKNSIYVYAIYSLVDNATQAYGNAKMWIYEVGTGITAIDALVAAEVNDGEYVPFIPVRIENKMLSVTHMPSAYQLAKKAYKQAGMGKFDDLIAAVEDNESLVEIDHAYVMFAVPLNVKERASREYLYRFFDKARLSQTTGGAEYAASQTQLASHESSKLDWNIWKAAQDDPMDPLYGTPAPDILPQPSIPGTGVHIKSSGTLDTKLNVKIKWGGITETTGTGLKVPDARKGQIWITIGGSTSGGSTSTIYSNGSFYGVGSQTGGVINIHWQVTDDSWKTLSITGLEHENLIYKTKSVIITGQEAIEDIEESGFLVPLHMATVREMRLVDSTQMMTAAAYMVFNSYKVVKKKWYQTGFFKIALFIVLVAITIIVFGPAAPGVLGTALAVGTSLGLTGIAAIIAGTIVNMLASMIISQIIMRGSTELFGAKWGALIGTIVSMITLNVATMASAGATLSQVGSTLASAQNIMAMTNAVGNGISGFLRGAAMETYAETAKMEKEAKRKARTLFEQFDMEFGYGRAEFDPMRTTDTMYGSFVESEADFLSRTLLTGSDIAEMSMSMVTDFAYHTIRLPLRP